MRSVHLPRAVNRSIVIALTGVGCALAACAVPLSTPMKETPSAWRVQAASAAAVVWVIFVDDLHVDFLNTGNLRKLLTAISRDLIADDDLFRVRSSGPSSLAIELTSDRTLLERAVRNTHGNGLRPSDILRVASGAVESTEIGYRATLAFSAASGEVRSLDDVHAERKAFIYISNGYSFDPYADAGSGASKPFVAQGTEVEAARLRRQVSELTRLAGAVGVRIFAIDPRSLPGAPSPGPTVDPVAWRNYSTITRRSLRWVSEQTGGFALVDAGDVTETVNRIKSAIRN